LAAGFSAPEKASVCGPSRPDARKTLASLRKTFLPLLSGGYLAASSPSTRILSFPSAEIVEGEDGKRAGVSLSSHQTGAIPIYFGEFKLSKLKYVFTPPDDPILWVLLWAPFFCKIVFSAATSLNEWDYQCILNE
jgi:hypothetical protein